jgi:aspartate aminotransferase
MIFSNRVKTLKPSPTLSISTKAVKMKAEGVDVLNLSLGEPDFNTPKEACEFGINAILNGQTKYTAVDGTLTLKKAIQSKFAKENNLNYELDEIFVSSGAKQGIFNAFASSLNYEDEVIIPAPYWVSYADIVEVFEGKPIIVKTSPKNNFKITPKELEASITSKTKWFLLNSPSNPTGEVYLEEELKALSEVLKKYPNIYIMSDDIYEHLVFDGLQFKNILNVAPELAERVLIINGVSKSFSMTGFRIGYGAMKNKDFIKMIVNLQSQSTSNACSISQEASLGALTKCEAFLPFMREIMEKRRNIFFEGLSKIPFIKTTKPSGAFYIFFEIKELYGKITPQGKVLKTDIEVAEYFLEEGRVATVFGSAFGYSGFIRVSYATDEKILLEAAKRLDECIKKLK